MKKLFFALAAVLFAACSTDLTEDVAVAAPDSIEVSFEEESRIQLSDDKTVWTKGDLLSVFYRSDANEQWKFQGNTGDRSGSIKRVMKPNATTKLSKIVAVYPYNENYYINPESCNIEAMLPAEQTYLKDSYGLDGNILVSQSEFNQIALRNVCGWLKIQLKGDGQVIEKITLKGNNNEQVAGLIYIDSSDATATLAAEYPAGSDDGVGGTLILDDTILKEVTLNCGEGVKLLPVATSFFIALPPQTFENGFTVEITDDSDYTMVQSTNKEQVIERNHILPMAAFTFINPNIATTPKPANNEIWYTATEKVEPYWDDANTYGVRLVTNTWDQATGKGIYTFAGDVTKVGAEAFLECQKLQTIVLPDSATEIGANAFKNCDGLQEVTIGDGVTKIGYYAFYDCDALTDIAFGNSLETIGYQAFYSCNNLKEVVIGGKVRYIDGRAFYECKKLTSVVIGDSVTGISDYVFYGCSSLTNVTIGSGLTRINSYVFYNCSSLQSIIIPDSVVTIESYAFNGCSKLENITFGSSIEDINPKAFSSCNAIRTLNGKYATADGRALIKNGKVSLYAKASGTEYTIPEGVTTIGSHAFYSSTLTSVTIPESVTAIEDNAFDNCTNLKKVYCNALTPPTLGTNVFSSNASGRRFYVYDEAVSAYQKIWGYSGSIYGNGSYDGSNTTTIYYTSTDGNIVNSEYLSIKENTYEDGQGKMVVCGKLDNIPTNAFYNKNNLASITIPDSVMDIGFGAFAVCQNLTSFSGKFVTDGGDAVIVGDKFIAFAPKSLKTYYSIPEYVTIIGDNAFTHCHNLQNVTLPNNATYIGDDTFSDCYSLESIIIPDNITTIGNNAFWSCGSLRDVTIGCNVTNIGYNAFGYCSDQLTVYMKPITPPSSVNENTFIHSWDSSWENCYLKIYVPVASEYVYKSSWTTWSNYIYPYDYDRVQTNYEIWYTSIDEVLIAPDTYYSNSSIISNTYKNGFGIITFDCEVTSVWESMFSYCDNLISVTLPDSVTTIENNAFCGCWNLTSVNIPDNITSIGKQAFYGCRLKEFNGKFASEDGRCLIVNGVLCSFIAEDLTSYTIPNDVTKIEDYVFASYRSLKSLTIPDSVTSIGDYAFYHCSYLTSIAMPNRLTSIGESAFASCSSLTSIAIPESVTTIGSEAFSYCSNLAEFKGKFADGNNRVLVVNGCLVAFAPAGITEYSIPNSVTSIDVCVFLSNKNLTSITIPDSVTSIGRQAFDYCQNLVNIYCEPTTPPTLSNNVFQYDVPNRKIYVPTNSVDAYKSANRWSYYKSNIEPYDF